MYDKSFNSSVLDSKDGSRIALCPLVEVGFNSSVLDSQ